MKFYEPDLKYIGTGEYGPEMLEADDGEWATRDDAEQMEKERNAYRDECITRGGRELQALCEKEQAAKERDEFERKCKELCFAYGQSLIELAQVKRDAVKMAELVKKYTYYTDQDWVEAQAIIERYEGGMGNG